MVLSVRFIEWMAIWCNWVNYIGDRVCDHFTPGGGYADIANATCIEFVCPLPEYGLYWGCFIAQRTLLYCLGQMFFDIDLIWENWDSCLCMVGASRISALSAIQLETAH